MPANPFAGALRTMRAARLRPLRIAVARTTYVSGSGEAGRSSWTPLPDIGQSLDEAFDLSFPHAAPTSDSPSDGR